MTYYQISVIIAFYMKIKSIIFHLSVLITISIIFRLPR